MLISFAAQLRMPRNPRRRKEKENTQRGARGRRREAALL